MIRPLALASIVAASSLVVSARAQSFNVEVGITPWSRPSPLYTAAGGQAGVWNSYLGSLDHVLVDLADAPTAVHLGAEGAGAEACEPTTLAGDDAALLEDNWFSGYLHPSFWSITGLAAGTYDFYAYLYAPCNPRFGGIVAFTEGATGGISTGAGNTPARGSRA